MKNEEEIKKIQDKVRFKIKWILEDDEDVSLDGAIARLVWDAVTEERNRIINCFRYKYKSFPRTKLDLIKEMDSIENERLKNSNKLNKKDVQRRKIKLENILEERGEDWAMRQMTKDERLGYLKSKKGLSNDNVENL